MSQEVKSISLNTKFATNFSSTGTGYLSTPIWVLPNQINKISSVKLKQLTMPLSCYNIDARNSKLSFIENDDGIVKNIFLTQKNYQGFSLADELTLKLNSVGSNVYDVIYDDIPGSNLLKFTITTGTSFKLVPTENNCYYEIGMDKKVGNEYGLITSSSIDLSGVSQVHLVSNIGGIELVNNQFKLLGIVTTEESALDISTFTDESNDYVNFTCDSLSEIYIHLYDSQFRRISPNKDWNVIINFILE
jgi:hypothetical protein